MDIIKLTEDQDKRVVVNDHLRDIMFGMGRKNAFVREFLTCNSGTTAQNRFIVPTMDTMATMTQWVAAQGAATYSTYAGDGGRLTVDASAALNFVVDVAGWAPQAVLCIPFGDQNDPDDWYDVSKIGNLKLDITDGVSDGVSKICIQQLKLY